MHIVYVVADQGIPVNGAKGASIHVQQIVRSLGRLGHDVTVVCANRGMEQGGFAVNAEQVHGPELAMHVDHLFAKADRRERQAMADAEAIEDHIVALAVTKPVQLIYERFSLLSRAGLNAARRLQIPLVVELNAPLREEQLTYRTLVHEDEAEIVERQVLGGAHRVVAVSDAVAAFARSCGAPAERVMVLPNAVDPDHFRPRPRRMPSSEDPFVIGFTGSLKPWHGLEYLLRAMRDLCCVDGERYRLVIVGKGPMQQWIEGFIAGAGIGDHVSMLGWVDYADLPEAIAGFDVAVAPYPDHQDFYFSPLKVFEYMAMGLPVVASNVGQIQQIVRHQRNGLLVAPESPAAIASAIRALRSDTDLKCRLGKAARTTSLNNTWSDNARMAVAGIEGAA